MKLSLLISATFSLILGSANLGAAGANEPYVWLQYVDTDLLSVRAISTGSCEELKASIALSERLDNTIEANPKIAVCEALIDLRKSEINSVTVEGHLFNFAREAPSRVVVLGDTGCKMLGNPEDQKCEGADWPFEALAKAAKKTAPDLIVHVGDQIYRYNCGRGEEGCGESHQLRDWSIWKDDFFDPVSELLPVAPWIFLHGNHEDCRSRNRAWRGWMLFLSMVPAQATPDAPVASTLKDCLDAKFDTAASRMIRFSAGSAPALNIFAHDSAAGLDPSWKDFISIVGETEETWIATHIPFVSFWRTRYVPAPEGLPNFRHGIPEAVSLILSGHVHLFQAVQDKPKAAIQVIAGGSGTKLDEHAITDTIYGEGYSYVVLDRDHAKTVMTVCVLDKQGQASAWRSWNIVQASPISGPVMSPLEEAVTSACTEPAL
ncbi:Calcineurin-like phosphoesterase [Roseovarius albus]|uniref:Calcineurin-like phosphoesterase n=1 Tax=Roseovarius albus TaxID=1247867 RepID=A0A1X6Z0X6_9RHOB|nr:metallophosphoesterase [Roseovarius albus]SLN36732.1 Calcineurin-like phosphoesterase [Roseovarius albus]